MLDYIIFAILIAIIIGQQVLIVFQHITHSKERKDLYNRIMARDLTEYTHAVQHEKEKDKQLSAMEKKYKEYLKEWK